MQKVTAYYVDARTGVPANIEPTRNGYVLPQENLVIDAIDYRQATPLIIGSIPKGSESAVGVTIITDEEHAALIESYDLWRIELTERNKSQALNAIDLVAGAARSSFVSEGALVEEEYRLALEQAKEWVEAGSPEDSVPKSVSCWAKSGGMTNEDAALNIMATGEGWNSVLLSIREVRLEGKAAVNACEDGNYSAAASPFIEALNSMKPE